jgi:hypothetical protein
MNAGGLVVLGERGDGGAQRFSVGDVSVAKSA